MWEQHKGTISKTEQRVCAKEYCKECKARKVSDL